MKRIFMALLLYMLIMIACCLSGWHVTLLDTRYSVADVNTLILIVAAGIGLIRWSRVPRILDTLDRISSEPRIVKGMIVLFAFCLLATQLLRHYAFETHAHDLRIHEELVRSTWSGPAMFSSLLGESFLAYHVSPIFFLFGLLYPIWPDPAWLLILQGVLIGFAGWFVWLLARSRGLRPTAAFAVTVTFFSYQEMMNGYFRGFHQEVVAIFFITGFLLAIERRYPVRAILMAVLAMTCREDVAIPIFIIGLLIFFVKRMRVLGAILATAALAWLLICYGWIIPAHAVEGRMTGMSRWGEYGASWGEIAMGLLSHPWRLISSLFNRSIIRMLARLFFLPILDPWTLLPILVPLAIYTTSSYSFQAHLGGAYAALFVPYLFAGVIHLLSRRPLHTWMKHAHFAFFFCIILTAINLKPLPYPASWDGVQKAHIRLKSMTRSLKGKRVLSQGVLIPHLGWPKHYDLIGSPRMESMDTYDIVLIAPSRDPWPVSREDIAKIQRALTADPEWRRDDAGCMVAFFQ